MQFLQLSILLLAVAKSAVADVHNYAACISNRRTSTIGGTPLSVSYNVATSYEILPESTRCACNLYRARNTGNRQWDRCPDCTFDGTVCGSAGWHIGGDEITYYCRNNCGAQGAEGN